MYFKWLNFVKVFAHQLENLGQSDPPYKFIVALNRITLGNANIWVMILFIKPLLLLMSNKSKGKMVASNTQRRNVKHI